MDFKNKNKEGIQPAAINYSYGLLPEKKRLCKFMLSIAEAEKLAKTE